MTTAGLAKLLAAVVAVTVVMLLVAPAVLAADADPPKATEPSEADETQRVLVLLDMPAPHFRPDGNYAGGYVDPAARSARRRTVNALARSYGLRLVTDWPLPALGVDCYVLDVPASQRPDEVAERLSREPRVAWAQPMNVFRPQGQVAHDDALFALQPAAREWRLAQLHAAATGRGVRVAVIDSGVQRDHPDLAGQLARARTSSPITPGVPSCTARPLQASSPPAPTTASVSSAWRRRRNSSRCADAGNRARPTHCARA